MREPKSAVGAAVHDELASIFEDLVELARSTTGLDAERVDELKQQFRERADTLGTGAKHAARTIVDQADDALDQVNSYARDKPWHLVLAAGLIGLAVGVLVARK